MKTGLKQSGRALVVAGLLCGIAGSLTVLPSGVEAAGYATSKAGDVVRSRTDCVRTRAWSRDAALRECDPGLFPEPEARAEQPAPAAAAAPKPTRISLKADSLFEFDSAELTEEGKRALDKIIELRSRNLQNPKIEITGYADRIGPEEYNLELSKKRALAVRDYLVSHGIDQNLITAKGLGAADPVATCEGMRGAELIRCLAPNRRTEVSFSAFEVVDEGEQPAE